MKKILTCIILITILLLPGCAKTASIKAVGIYEKQVSRVEKPEPHLTVGEKFTFLVAWKGIPIGYATSEVKELTIFREYPVYKIEVIAKTNKFLSKIFRVEDKFISYVDRKKLISRRYEAYRREGKYKKDVIVDYDFENNVAIYRNLLDGTTKQNSVKKNVHDPISAAYFLRTVPINVGDEIKVAVNLNEKNYEIIAKIEKQARIGLHNLGTFDAFLIKPYIKLSGKLQRRAKCWGYISSDKKRLGLYMVVKVLEIPWIGDISVTLNKVEYRPGSKE